MTIHIELAQPIAKKLKILFYGASGSGKTLAALSFPRVLLVDAESGADLYAGRPGIAPFHRVRIKTISELQEVLRAVEADAGKQWDTLVIDPISVFYDVEKNVASSNNTRDMDYRGWAKINNRMGSLYNMLTGLNVHVVLIARESIEYEGNGSNLKKVGVKPDADKKLVYSMDFVLRLTETHSAQVEKSRGVVLGKGGNLESVSWSDFKDVAQLYVQGERQQYTDEEEAARLEADNLANDDVRKEFTEAWVKQGLTHGNILTALKVTRLGEWPHGRAKADAAVKEWHESQLSVKPASPKGYNAGAPASS